MKRSGPPKRLTALKSGGQLKRTGPIKAKRKAPTVARQLANGKPCMVRIPGHCLRTTDTTVLAHYRLQSGGGLKPSDEQGAWACFACHNLVDGRTETTDFTYVQLRLYHAEGVFRTQEAIRLLDE